MNTLQKNEPFGIVSIIFGNIRVRAVQILWDFDVYTPIRYVFNRI